TARWTGLEDRLAEAVRKQAEAEAEVARLRARAETVAAVNEAELGRLERGAVAALESTLAVHRERLAVVEDRLRRAQDAAREQAQLLEEERSRTRQLQAALARRRGDPPAPTSLGAATSAGAGAPEAGAADVSEAAGSAAEGVPGGRAAGTGTPPGGTPAGMGGTDRDRGEAGDLPSGRPGRARSDQGADAGSR
ncbi:MAG TPA: hypothetical protein VI248_03860, partial [Kineosporiaceae bacterium]